MIARELPWGTFADDPLHITMRCKGLDLTGATLGYFVQANAYSTALIELANTTTAGADGVRIVATGEDADGIYTDIEILAGQATVTAALASFLGQGQLTLYHKFQWTLPPSGTFSSVDKTVFFGTLTVTGGTNG